LNMLRQPKLYAFLLFGVLLGALASFHLLAALLAAGLLCGVALVLADYRRGLMVLALYAVLDYGIRAFAPFVASIWDELLMLGLFGLWALKYIVYRRDNCLRATPLDVPILLYFCVNSLVLFVATPSFRIGVDGMRANVQFMLWYFVAVALLKEKKDAWVLVNILLVVGTLIGLHGCYQYVTGVPMPVNWIDSAETGVRTRAFSIIGSPNILGSLMALLAPISAALCLADKNKLRKLMYLCMTLAMGGCLVFTMSRGAWLGFGLAALILVLFIDSRLLIPAALLALLACALMPDVTARILYMLSPEYIESSQRGGRLIRWQTGFDIISEQPAFGAGLGHWGGAVAQNYKVAIKIRGGFTNTVYIDSYFLKIATEGGIVLFLGFIHLVYEQMIWCYKAIKEQTDKFYRYLAFGIFAGLAAVLAHNIAENVFEVPMMTTYFWLLVGILMHLWRLATVEKKASEAVQADNTDATPIEGKEITA